MAKINKKSMAKMKEQMTDNISNFKASSYTKGIFIALDSM
jgi:hypothetical protein